MVDISTTASPFSASNADGAAANFPAGRGGEVLVAQIHGKFFPACARNAEFVFTVNGVALNKIGATYVSSFSLYNPVGSNRMLELVDFDLSIIVSVTVVDTISLYFSSPVTTAAGTFTTAGTVQSGLLNSGYTGVGVPYSAYTYPAGTTPTKWMAVGMFGAVSTNANQVGRYAFDGKAVIPPGSLVSLAPATASTAASTISASISWNEPSIV